MLYLSGYVLRHKADYHRLLLGVTAEQTWEPWLLFMLKAIEDTACWTTARIHAIRQLMQVTQAHVREHAPKLYTRELVELIFVQPYCRIANLIDAGIAKRQAASTYLKTLVDLDVLEVRKIGRDKLFVHPRFLGLLASDEHVVTGYARGRVTP